MKKTNWDIALKMRIMSDYLERYKEGKVIAPNFVEDAKRYGVQSPGLFGLWTRIREPEIESYIRAWQWLTSPERTKEEIDNVTSMILVSRFRVRLNVAGKLVSYMRQKQNKNMQENKHEETAE